MAEAHQQDSTLEPRQDELAQQAKQGRSATELPSINADRTAPYPDPLVNQVEQNTYGATESQVNRSEEVIAPTFSDTEPGAGPNYGAAGDPDAPNLGGIEDETTLGPDQVRPPGRRLVRDGEFEAGGDRGPLEPPSASSSAGNSDFAMSNVKSSAPAKDPGAQSSGTHARTDDQHSGNAGASRENPLAAPGGASPQIPLSPRTNAAPGHGNNLGGAGAYGPRPLPGEATQGAARMMNPTTDRITEHNMPGPLPSGRLTYGNPQAYAGDCETGRVGASSGSAGELPGGRMIELAHGGEAAQPRRTDPDMPGIAPTSLDASEPVRDTGRQHEEADPPNQSTLTP